MIGLAWSENANVRAGFRITGSCIEFQAMVCTFLQVVCDMLGTRMEKGCEKGVYIEKKGLKTKWAACKKCILGRGEENGNGQL